jgi:hypothetical protein
MIGTSKDDDSKLCDAAKLASENLIFYPRTPVITLPAIPYTL